MGLSLLGACTSLEQPTGKERQHIQPLSLEQRIQSVEDRAALKTLVDTFSNLADAKDVKSQVLLFTEDATVDSYVGGALTSSLKGREQIGQRFGEYLANFTPPQRPADGGHSRGSCHRRVLLPGRAGRHEGGQDHDNQQRRDLQ
nr:nuclear transport factor 2 family protein [Ramlibacter henchirensis]